MEPNGYEDYVRRWWMRPKWLAALAAFIAACSFAAFTSTTIITSARTEETSGDVQDLEGAILAIQKNQEGIDEIVAFVHCIQTQNLEDCIDAGPTSP